jgi:hypothetical protein
MSSENKATGGSTINSLLLAYLQMTKRKRTLRKIDKVILIPRKPALEIHLSTNEVPPSVDKMLRQLSRANSLSINFLPDHPGVIELTLPDTANGKECFRTSSFVLWDNTSPVTVTNAKGFWELVIDSSKIVGNALPQKRKAKPVTFQHVQWNLIVIRLAYIQKKPLELVIPDDLVGLSQSVELLPIKTEASYTVDTSAITQTFDNKAEKERAAEIMVNLQKVWWDIQTLINFLGVNLQSSSLSLLRSMTQPSGVTPTAYL